MTGTYFESFMVGGLALLVAAALSVAWLLWRQNDTRKESIALALEGIGHEFRFNMFQTVREIGELSDGTIRLAIDLPRLAQPQLDGLLAHLVATDKRALAAVQATYERIEASKRRVRMELDEGELGEDTLEGLKRATVDGISTLYLWEEHEGRPPSNARSTRSWWVRDWMKAHGFAQDLVPGIALRDSVVDHLRDSGMVLTPQPLALSAYEYYGRQYDRHADPRGIFGKRRTRKEKPLPVPVDDTDEDPEEADFVEEAVVEAEVVETAPEAEMVDVREEPVVRMEAVDAHEPVAAPEEAPAVQVSEPEPEPEPQPEPAPQRDESAIDWAATAAAAASGSPAAPAEPAASGEAPVNLGSMPDEDDLKSAFASDDDDDDEFEDDDRRRSSSVDAAE